MIARNALLISLLTVFLVGCGGTPFTYQSRNEIPEGPGIFSGETGEFTVYSDKKAKVNTPATAKVADASTPEAYGEFQEFQEFQRWKEANKDTPEYKEFQDWREWKAYRAWKATH
ncbi:MAG: hypothetical protein HY308_03045 [Gammaproteobacteria bacterium]|nr:hypothetical protein [Gammaproteobacteria bacterium]